MYSSKPTVIALCHIFCMRQMQVTFLKCEWSLPEEDLYLYTLITLVWEAVIAPFKLHNLQTPDVPNFCVQKDRTFFFLSPQCEVAVLSAKGYQEEAWCGVNRRPAWRIGSGLELSWVCVCVRWVIESV